MYTIFTFRTFFSQNRIVNSILPFFYLFFYQGHGSSTIVFCSVFDFFALTTIFSSDVSSGFLFASRPLFHPHVLTFSVLYTLNFSSLQVGIFSSTESYLSLHWRNGAESPVEFNIPARRCPKSSAVSLAREVFRTFPPPPSGVMSSGSIPHLYCNKFFLAEIASPSQISKIIL